MSTAYPPDNSSTERPETADRVPVRAPGGLGHAERQAMLRAIPALRAFATTLVGNKDRSDDLVQDTLVRAISCIDSFTPGTNMTAWLITILRNNFLTQCRRQRTAEQFVKHSAMLPTAARAEQYGGIELQELREALMTLPHEQREALILVGASGYSCDEAAAICGCPAGTIKSRVNRARAQLSKLMQVDGDDTFGPDRQELAIVA